MYTPSSGRSLLICESPGAGLGTRGETLIGQVVQNLFLMVVFGKRELSVGCGGLFLYGGMGTAIRSVNSAGFANNGAITNTAKPAVCNAMEIAIARRLIFLSRAFFSGSPSTRQPSKVPVHGSAFTRSSLDITHLPKNLIVPTRLRFAAPASAGCLAVAGAALAGM